MPCADSSRKTRAYAPLNLSLACLIVFYETSLMDNRCYSIHYSTGPNNIYCIYSIRGVDRMHLLSTLKPGATSTLIPSTCSTNHAGRIPLGMTLENQRTEQNRYGSTGTQPTHRCKAKARQKGEKGQSFTHTLPRPLCTTDSCLVRAVVDSEA